MVSGPGGQTFQPAHPSLFQNYLPTD
ncbi:uncharacterized protein METZ01_LOCUS176202 [marine metagenome]|uniref:Uncharacterized protein n=1 Tax=marine metagenome TaxID=408172 RepID=A0A382CB56_9ZZZZ